MNKKLMEFGAFFVMLFLVMFAVIVYIMKYHDLSSLNKIDGSSIILGSLVMLNVDQNTKEKGLHRKSFKWLKRYINTHMHGN